MNLLRFPALLLALVCATHAAPPARPNILLIVSDDQGSADAGFRGSKDIPTPRLDRLCAEGIHCTSGYVSHPYCSPTRAGLMTGRYQQRFGHENNPFYDPSDHREGLPASETLLPEYLRKAGYKTGWIGKWHLGAAPEFRPRNRGFEETFGFIGGGHHYQNWKPDHAVEYNVPIERNGSPVETTGHLTTTFGNEAAAFIERHPSDPWFLYLAFNAPHTPHEPTAERLARFSHIPDPKRRRYAAQVSLLDDAIGTTLDALHRSGQDQRTLVFFFSDNGGHVPSGSSNGTLRDGKGSVYEGGIRVPFLVRWTGTLAAGTTYPLPVCSLDVFATSLALAGVPMPTDKPHDSTNLIPYLRGTTSGAPHNPLFWRSGGQSAVHDGSDKLVRHKNQPDELYNLATDPAEHDDRGTTRTTDLTRLANELDAWNQQLIPPAFPGLQAKRSPNPTTKTPDPREP